MHINKITTLTQYLTEKFDFHSKCKFIDLSKSSIHLSCGYSDLLDDLESLYPALFNITDLSFELKILYGYQEFQEKPVNDILKYFELQSMKELFKETKKLCSLITTLPLPRKCRKSFFILMEFKKLHEGYPVTG